MSDEIRYVIEGTGQSAAENLIRATLRYLETSSTAGRAASEPEFNRKKDEAQRLIAFADQTQCWHPAPDPTRYMAEGAEQRVYLHIDGRSVVKVNDAIFYESWTDYLVSLLLHNYLFPATAYELMGFLMEVGTFYAVVRQSFVLSTEPVDLKQLRVFLQNNGFVHRRNNDYFHPQLGVILEDLHDENVLVNKETFFFIDSAIYLMP